MSTSAERKAPGQAMRTVLARHRTVETHAMTMTFHGRSGHQALLTEHITPTDAT